MAPNALTAPIFQDAEIAALFEDKALLAQMALVEGALAKVQGDLGIIPTDSAAEIEKVVKTAPIDLAKISEGVRASGIPVPALISQLRALLKAPHDDYLHWGATSQDIIDTAYVLAYRSSLQLIGGRLTSLITQLKAESQQYENTVMAGRTRGQLATPITFGLRIAQWAQPLIHLENELLAINKRALKVQFGGASGSRNIVAPHGAEITSRLAKELGLQPGPPWHRDRSGLRTMAGWLGSLVAALGKMAGDMLIASRGEIAELRAGVSGGSSTMPNKANPVTAEALLSANQIAIACEAGLAASAIHGEERDGAMWSAEWQLIPQLFETAGAALRHGETLVSTMQADANAMKARLDVTPDLLAESVTFAIAGKFGRQKAQSLVKSALTAGTTSDGSFEAAIEKAAPGLVDWEKLRSFDEVIASSKAVSDEIFAERNA